MNLSLLTTPVEDNCRRMAEATRSLSTVDWQSYSWREVKVKRPPAPRQLHTAVEYKDCMVCFMLEKILLNLVSTFLEALEQPWVENASAPLKNLISVPNLDDLILSLIITSFNLKGFCRFSFFHPPFPSSLFFLSETEVGSSFCQECRRSSRTSFPHSPRAQGTVTPSSSRFL